MNRSITLSLLSATILAGFVTTAYAQTVPANTVNLEGIRDSNLSVSITQLNGSGNTVATGAFQGYGTSLNLSQVGSGNNFTLNPGVTPSDKSQTISNGLVINASATGKSNSVRALVYNDGQTPSTTGNKVVNAINGNYNSVDTATDGNNDRLTANIQGDSNDISQWTRGSNDSLSVTINGSANYVDEGIVSSNYSIDNAQITGNKNRIQSYISGNYDYTQETIIGNNNTLTSNVYGDHNTVVLAASGDNNTLTSLVGTKVAGSGNYMSLAANGNNNNITGTQDGTNNFMKVAINGSNNTNDSFTQIGTGKSLNFSYTGSGLTGLKVTQ